MHFIELKEKMRDYVVFSLQDIRKIDKDFYRSRLSEWQNKGYIKKIRRSYYMFSDTDLNESVLFCVANKIYSPSYISFEMALSYYGLIPESVYGITSATSNKTNIFKTKIGEFNYRHIKPDLMFAYKLIKTSKMVYKIAEPEKAILDFFYINTHLDTEDDFFELRINGGEFNSEVNLKKIKKYLIIFNNKKLEKRIKKFLKYIDVKT